VVEDRKRCGWGVVLAAVTLFATLLLTVPAGPATAAPGEGAPVLVRHTPAGGTEVRALVRRLGGTVGRDLRIIDGFAAEVPAAALPRLRASAAVPR
jgi:serine protease AprX